MSGPGIVDLVDDPFFVAAAAQIAAALAGQFELGIERANALRRLFDDGIAGAEQKEPGAAPLREAGDVVEQVGGGHPFRQRGPAQQPRGKNQRHAVGMDEIGGEKQVANCASAGRTARAPGRSPR